MPTYTDQIGNKIELEKIPERIISLVPSQTELLFDLGLGDRIVGITKFCVHPKEAKETKKIIGGTKNLRFDEIDALKPDLIIGNKEENTRIGVQILMKDYPVWISDIKNIEDNYLFIESIGAIFNKQNEAQNLINSIKDNFSILQSKVSYLQTQPKVLYLIWKDPYMSIGNDTIIHNILQKAGFDSITANFTRYPEINLEEIKKSKPNFVFLSSEPYPFTVKHVEGIRHETGVEKVILVDGEKFSWYGSRLKYSAEYLMKLRTELGL